MINGLKEAVEVLQKMAKKCHLAIRGFETEYTNGTMGHDDFKINIKHQMIMQKALHAAITFIEEILKEECEHVKEDSIAADCILCRLAVAEKTAVVQKELRLKAEKIVEGLPSEEDMRKIIDKTAVVYNKEGITPSFIWNCTLEELAKAIHKRMMEGR